MAKKGIPDSVKKQVGEIVNRFNRQIIKNPNYFYSARYRVNYLYFSRNSFGVIISPICRLKYTGSMDSWEFAIYKYSSERYDPNEWSFPGSGSVDGTVEGALHAGLEAYP